MKPKCIGIIGGAGPLAGAYFLSRIFSLSVKFYGCHKDSDFPKVILVSFPFSEMLCKKQDVSKLQAELSGCLRELRQQGASIIAIACNTLHAFLKEESDDLVHLPSVVATENLGSVPPLVLCTSTSVAFGIHRQFFPCVYPDQSTQREVDRIIDQILKGGEPVGICRKLKKLIQKQDAKTVILGCTELSLFYSDLIVLNKTIIDPVEIAVRKILKRCF